jgi:hypothetical protein
VDGAAAGHGDLEIPDAAGLDPDAGSGVYAGEVLQDELRGELDPIEQGEAEYEPPERQQGDQEERGAEEEAELHKKLLIAISYELLAIR